MKKVAFILPLVAALFLSGCRLHSPEDIIDVGTTEIEFIYDEMGKNLSEALEQIEIDGEAPLEERRSGEFLFPEKLLLCEQSFDIYLETQKETEIIIGGLYECSFSEETAVNELVQVFNDLVNELKNHYGEPSTSDELETTEPMRKDPVAFLEDKGGLYEVWDLGKGQLEEYPDYYTGIWLHIDYYPGNQIYLIRIEYHLIKTPYM